MTMPRRQGPDIGAVAALLDERIDEVVAWLGLSGRREFVALNPTRADRYLGSFRIDLAGGKRGRDVPLRLAILDALGIEGLER